jgi:putative hydrolase of the HAD superfamily
MIKHLFFDLDHTLWDFETNSDLTFEMIFKRNGVEVDQKGFADTYRPINKKYWKLFREDKVSKSDLRYNRLKEAFDAIGYKASDELIHLLSEEYIQFLSGHNNLFSHAHETLSYLGGKYQMHIITNGFEEVQFKKLRNSRLLPYFKQVITSERVGVKKPHPKIFEFALELAGAEAGHSMMIGDNFEADIQGAMSVGMQAIFCEFNGEIATQEVTAIRSLIELREYL